VVVTTRKENADVCIFRSGTDTSERSTGVRVGVAEEPQLSEIKEASGEASAPGGSRGADHALNIF
jgi:hypothetical protein